MIPNLLRSLFVSSKMLLVKLHLALLLTYLLPKGRWEAIWEIGYDVAHKPGEG
ncbi:MAG: hypothetical protein RMJ00_01095 [Nitrososphaerota archaeon]|nr:hypothetical protein [Nitrososphaerota archaeon]